jgi:ribosomal protein L37AE/L43A
MDTCPECKSTNLAYAHDGPYWICIDCNCQFMSAEDLGNVLNNQQIEDILEEVKKGINYEM